jgi:hypothetical protein
MPVAKKRTIQYILDIHEKMNEYAKIGNRENFWDG